MLYLRFADAFDWSLIVHTQDFWRYRGGRTSKSRSVQIVLSSNPERIDNELLTQFDEFNQFRHRQRDAHDIAETVALPNHESGRL